MLKPRLVKATMLMRVVCKDNSVEHRQVDCELWEPVGLCLHMYEGKYRISHFLSGCSVLINIVSREYALIFMIRLRKEVMSNWKLERDKFQASNDYIESKLKVSQFQEQIAKLK